MEADREESDNRDINRLHEFGEMKCNSKCYYCFGENDEIPETDVALPSIDNWLKAAQIVEEKNFISLERFRDTKSFKQIRDLIFHCRYPEDEVSPSGKMFLPMLILKRCKILIRKPPPFFYYPELYKDLLTLEEEWIHILPWSQHHTLYYLKTFCLIQLRQFHSARISLEQTKEALEFSSLDEQEVSEWEKKLDKGLKTIQANGSKDQEMPKPYPCPEDLPEIKSRNARYPSLSDAVQLNVAKNGGYFISAVRDIQPGELLALEQALVSMPLYQNSYLSGIICTHCYRDTLHPLPCPGCSSVIFCSLKCKNEAVQSYHKFECKVRLQCITKFALQRYKFLRFIFKQDPDALLTYFKNGESSDPFLKEISWLLKLQLKNHALKKDLLVVNDPNDEAISVDILERSGYLDSIPQSRKKELATWAAESFFKLNQLFAFVLTKSHAKIMDNPIRMNKIPRQDYYCMAIFAQISHFNHSCTPNTFPVTKGDRMALFSNGLIRKGEEVTFHSDADWADSYESRQSLLLETKEVICECQFCRKKLGGEAAALKILMQSDDYCKEFGDKEDKFIRAKDFDGLINFRAEMFARKRNELDLDKYLLYTLRNRKFFGEQIRRKYQMQERWH